MPSRLHTRRQRRRDHRPPGYSLTRRGARAQAIMWAGSKGMTAMSIDASSGMAAPAREYPFGGVIRCLWGFAARPVSV